MCIIILLPPVLPEQFHTHSTQKTPFRKRFSFHDGTNALTYDDNGNLTSDGVNSYTWDCANRLLEVDTGTPAELTAYAYDGVGNRIAQAIGTSSPVVTQYLLDTQPGLAKVIAATTGGSTDRYVHGPRGIHAMEDNGGNWTWAIQDAQGSVRGEVDNTLAVLGIQHPDPYGNLFGQQGSIGMPFAYTGEMRDPIGLQYHRARYYNPAMGGWLSLDPFEGQTCTPMSLNGYSWVEGQAVNAVDPSGMCMNPLVLSILFNFGLQNTVPQQGQEGTGKCFSACDIKFIARVAHLEGKDAGEGAILGLVLKEINHFKFTGIFDNYDAVADKFGFARSTNVHSPYVNSFCNSDTFSDRLESLALQFAMLATEGECLFGNPLELASSSGYILFAPQADRPKLGQIAGNPSMRFEQSFDSTVFSVLDEWQNLARLEKSGTLGGSTYNSLLPGTSSFVLFEPTGRNARGVIISNDFNPIHTAWQCPQDSNNRLPDNRVSGGSKVKINYRLASGGCATCNPAGCTSCEPPVSLGFDANNRVIDSTCEII